MGQANPLAATVPLILAECWQCG